MRSLTSLAALLAALAAAQTGHAGSRAEWVATLTCAESDQMAYSGPGRGERLAGGRVTMPAASAVLQLGPRESDGFRFAKRGVSVRSGGPVTLRVPRELRSVYRLSWGGEYSPHGIRFTTCAGRRWTHFAGGYYVRKPACVAVLVTAGGRTSRLRVGVGRRCS
jgi:hypothetical protein